MTKLSERYPDLLDEHAPPDRLRLVGDLDTALAHSTLPAHLRASMDGVVREHMATARRTAPTRRSARAATLDVLIATGCEHLSSLVQSMPHPLSKRAIASWQMRLCLASLVAALLLALGSITGYLPLYSPAPVSAQTVLQHAAAALSRTAPDQVLHQTSQLYIGDRTTFGMDPQTTFASGPITLTVDQWTQFDATGAISRQVTTGTSSTGALVFRILQTGATAQIYSVRENVIETRVVPTRQSIYWVDRPLGMIDLGQLVLAAAHGSIPNTKLKLLPQQTLDGATVDVVAITFPPPAGGTLACDRPLHCASGHASRQHARRRHDRGHQPWPSSHHRLYIDAHTYAIRGMDGGVVTAQGTATVSMSMRVIQSTTVPLSAVPADTFVLNAPANARAVPPVYQPLTGRVRLGELPASL